MSTRNQIVLAIFITIASMSGATAQTNSSNAPQWNDRDKTYQGQVYDVLDPKYIPASRMKQHQAFLDHRYVFPAKPRNMWEIGVGAGTYNIFGDVPHLMAWQRDGGYALHAHIRKAWGYVISSRIQYNYGIGKGIQWQESRNYKYNPAWNGHYNAAGNAADVPSDGIHYNYRMESHQLNLDLVATANNIRFHKARSAWSVYGFVSASTLAYKTYVNALNGGQAYNYSDILGEEPQIYENRKEIRANLQNGMDKSYETAAESEAGRSRMEFGKRGLGGIAKTWLFAPSFGGGFQVRITKHVNFSVEDRLTIPLDDDLIDGQRWSEQVYGSAVLTAQKDVINYLNLGFNFNIGNSKNSIEPLYWINPLIYAYSQFDRATHPQFPEAILPDEDLDGITDQFDLCPGTPTNVAVDLHGCPMDTDGDAVPDFRDKQLITPTECQPSDADGIGKCPCPDCLVTAPPGDNCENIPTGLVTFPSKSAELTTAAKRQLDALVDQLRFSAPCNILLTSYKSPERGTDRRLLGERRGQAVQEYLYEHGIDRSRINLQFHEEVESETPTVEFAPDRGPATFDRTQQDR